MMKILHVNSKASIESWQCYNILLCCLMQVVINNDTGRSKGFGFVKFEDTRDAEDAIKEADGLVSPS